MTKALRILIADDHDLMRRGIKGMLQSHAGMGNLRRGPYGAGGCDQSAGIEARYRNSRHQYAGLERRRCCAKDPQGVAKHRRF